MPNENLTPEQQPAETPEHPPVAAKHPTERVHHGDVFVDDYEWLRAKEAPEVIGYLEAENAWTTAQTDHLAGLRKTLFEEIRNRTQETDLSVPVREGGYWYYTRTVEGKQYPIHARVPVAAPDDWTPPSLEGDAAEHGLPGEQVLLDHNVEAEGHDFFSLGSFDVSGDGTRLLYAVDTEGDERFTLRVRDLETGEDLPDVVEQTFPGAFFAPGPGGAGEYLFYSTVDDAWRPDTIWRHRVGTPAADDVKVFHEPDERFWVGAGLTRSRRFLQIELGSKVTSECWILEADDPTGEFRVVWPRRQGVEYQVDHVVLPAAPSEDEVPDAAAQDALLILHDGGSGVGADNFELAVVPVPGVGEVLDPAAATVVVPSSLDRRLTDVDAFAGHVAVSYREGAIPRVGLLQPAAGEGEWPLAEVGFDQPLYSAALAGNAEWEQPTLRLAYGSFVEPATVLDLVVATGERLVRKVQPVRGGYDPAHYVQRPEWVTAEDGTQVPVSLVWRRDAVPTTGAEGEEAPSAPAPMLLYGYGSYETSIDPAFSIPRLSLLDRGVVYAVAHVRGGGELGRHWYDDGKELHKRNTFTDFVAVGRGLVERGWTAPDRLVAEGRSAGGLLMGAVTNLAPDLFAGVHAGVPFVDALTSILDPSLPLTVVEWEEWGNPLEDAEVYRYMKSYTPYENVADGVTYPRILATTSINDTRVLYVEPAKWTARLREVGAPVLLKTEMSAGHGGVSGRYARWEELAFETAWELDVLGLA